MGLRRAFTAAEWENNNNLGKKESYYDSHTNTNASIKKRKETEERTHAVNSKFVRLQYKNKVEIITSVKKKLITMLRVKSMEPLNG